jgi:RND family efflux transporter MFP subunit
MRAFIEHNRRNLALLLVLLPLLALFGWVALRSGPMAPIPVTVTRVETRALAPGQFGIGTVEARHRYRIGPTAPGRLLRVHVDVGDRIAAGALLAEMDPVDLDARLAAQQAALAQLDAREAAARARVAEMQARAEHARLQLDRYRQLLETRATTEEAVDLKRVEAEVAQAVLRSATAELATFDRERARLEAERDALRAQRRHLRLEAPVDGLVVAREAEAGSTLVAGQTVLELIDPDQLWIEARFDQISARGLEAGQDARIVLRSRGAEALPGRVLRIEPLADSVTEEIRARLVFTELPRPLPPLGELAEVTVALAPLAPAPTVPAASLQRVEGETGVWIVDNDELEFRPVRPGRRDLAGRVRIMAGLEAGETVVEFALQPLTRRSAFRVVDQLQTGRRL